MSMNKIQDALDNILEITGRLVCLFVLIFLGAIPLVLGAHYIRHITSPPDAVQPNPAATSDPAQD